MFDRFRLRPLLVLLAVMLVTALVVAGCGDDDDDDNGGATTTEQVTTETGGTTSEAAGPTSDGPTVINIPIAESGLAFAVTEATAPAGEVVLRTTNPQGVDHNIAIDAPDPVVSDTVSDGGVAEIHVTLEPGTYEYYCEIPGHRDGGMVGTLTVE